MDRRNKYLLAGLMGAFGSGASIPVVVDAPSLFDLMPLPKSSGKKINRVSQKKKRLRARQLNKHG